MMQNEKARLLALFADKGKWCQRVEARDAQGNPVRYDDQRAAAWDVVGGMCLLFGWPRARKLFPQVGRTVAGSKRPLIGCRDREMSAMTALLDFNDEQKTTHAVILARLQEVQVYFKEPAARP
jgi:hypothetical protein